MCRTRSLGGRTVALLALVLQLALAAALPLAHARVEAAELFHQVHLEAEGSGVCLPHNDFDCQLCRQHPIADLASGSPSVAAHAPTHDVPGPAAITSADPGMAPFRAALGPRAPPLA